MRIFIKDDSYTGLAMALSFMSYLFLIMLWGCGAVAEDIGSSEQLYFMLMTSRSSLFNTSGIVGGVDMALEAINSNPNLLPRYQLNYTTLFDSECSVVKSLDIFLDEVQTETSAQYIAVIGAGCSIAVEPVADIVQNFNMPMVSYAATAKILSDRKRFKSFFRTSPSEIFLSGGIAGLVRYFRWKQIGFITQKESLFQDAEMEVTSILAMEGSRSVEVKSRQFATADGPLIINDLFVEDDHVRVFILNMYPFYARVVLCEAFKKGMTYPRYVWLTYGWYRKDWWRAEGSAIPVNCTDAQLAMVLNNSLAIIPYPNNDLSQPTVTNITGHQFLMEYGRHAKMYDLEFTLISALAYDAVLALALALNDSIAMVNINDNTGCDQYGNLTEYDVYHNFTYTNSKLWCLLDQNLARVDFTGVSGEVQFENGDRIDDTLRVDQYRSVGGSPLQRVYVGNFLNASDFVYVADENSQTVWPAGIPRDGVPETITTTVALPLTIIYCVLTFCGIMLVLVCFIFNVVFRNRKVVRLTSPNLNYLILLGAILLYLSVVFLIIPTLEQNISTIYCNIDVWFFSVGNTLCFAVVLAKMWRVYYIYNNIKPSHKPKPPKDWHLLMIIAAIVATDIVIILVPTAIPSARLTSIPRLNRERPEFVDGEPVMFVFYYCTSDSHLIWLGLSYAYKLFLQAIAMYFAFRTRKVRIRALNDSKAIAAAIYITSLILVALVGIDLASDATLPNVNIAFVGFGRLVYPSVILGFVFIPKMINLYRDPKGEHIFTQGSTLYHTGEGILSGGKEKMEKLEKEVIELKHRLKEYEDIDDKKAPVTNGTVHEIDNKGYLGGAGINGTTSSE